MVVALVGVTMGILYCRRKEYAGHRPTLMDDVDAQDDYRLWALQIWVGLVVTHWFKWLKCVHTIIWLCTCIKSHLEQGRGWGCSTLLLNFGDLKEHLTYTDCDLILCGLKNNFSIPEWKTKFASNSLFSDSSHQLFWLMIKKQHYNSLPISWWNKVSYKFI